MFKRLLDALLIAFELRADFLRLGRKDTAVALELSASGVSQLFSRKE